MVYREHDTLSYETQLFLPAKAGSGVKNESQEIQMFERWIARFKANQG